MIKNADWDFNPAVFEYKRSESDQPIVASANDVKEFGISEQFKYKSFTGKVDRSSIDANKLKDSKIGDFKTETVFLKVQVEGSATLYSLVDGPIVKFFYEVGGKPIEQLVFVRYLAQPGQAAENNQFRQQLYNNVRNENTSEKLLKNIRYKRKELTDYFLKFNNSSAAAATLKSVNTENTVVKNKAVNTKNYERKPTEHPFSIGVSAGLALGKATVKVTNEATYFAGSKSIDLTGSSFKIGADAEYILPFNKNKWALFINPSYQQFSSEGSLGTPGIYSTSPDIMNFVETEYNSIEVPLGIRYYMYVYDNSRFFLELSYAFTATTSSSLLINDVPNPTEYAVNRNSIGIGAGFYYKKFGVSLRQLGNRNYFRGLADYSSTNIILFYKFL